MKKQKYNRIKQEFAGDNILTQASTVKLSSWLLLFIYISIYLLCIYLLIKFSHTGSERWTMFNWKGLTRLGLIGIIAQTQSFVILLMILNPVKQSRAISILLTGLTALGALYSTFIRKNLDSIAGVLTHVSTILFVVIISRYWNKLNKQIRKVTEYNKIIKESEAVLHHMAYYDSLTELPNRSMMIKEMEKLTNSVASNCKNFSFVYVDLDNFKKINDTMGHIVGDEVLKQIVLRWRKCLQDGDILGRLGGDEFALLIRRPISKEQLVEYMEELKASMSEPFTCDKKEFYVSASSGITNYPHDGSDSTELMKNADIALYRAKYNGKNGYQFFDSEIMGEVLTYIKLDNGLQSAVRNQELFMVFQPIYYCSSNRLRGYEALIRWNHSELGLVNPMQFISIAEVNGTIVEIGRWVLNHVLSIFMEFQKKFEINPIISINISVVQMLESDFVQMVKDVLDKTGFEGRYLEMEITESVLISSPEKIINVIKQLSTHGILFALDDFGSGYASLSSLQLLKPNLLKIDKSLINEITIENPVSHIVGSIISLAHQLNIEVVAEGVETEEQYHYLKANQCDYIQGYLLSKPINEDQLLKMEHK